MPVILCNIISVGNFFLDETITLPRQWEDKFSQPLTVGAANSDVHCGYFLRDFAEGSGSGHIGWDNVRRHPIRRI